MRGELDGGMSWLIVLSSFIQQFVVMGTHNVFGLFYIDLLNEFKKSKAATGKKIEG
jgi:MCP family monocarboxylic acid transporter-like MFS transporter 10